MIFMNRIIIATTTFYDDTEDGNLRKSLSKEFVRRSKEKDYPLIVVNREMGDRQYINELRSQGALVFPETQEGLGPSRREAINQAYLLARKQNIPYILWSEPEKIDLFNHLDRISNKIARDKFDALALSRLKMKGYPLAQQLSERLGNSLLERDYMHIDSEGKAIDTFFGPVLWKTEYTPFFIAFGSNKVSEELATMRLERLSQYYKINTEEIRHFERDKAEIDLKNTDYATHMPIYLMILNGLNVLSFPIDYQHPREQTLLEERNGLRYNSKRISQLTAILEQFVLTQRIHKNKTLVGEILTSIKEGKV